MANLYEVNDVVYLSESAKLGFLESYQVSGVRQDASGEWLYNISVPQRSPTSLPTYGDRITLTKSIDFELHEYELISFCDAIDYALLYLTNNLARMEQLKAARCPDSSEA